MSTRPSDDAPASSGDDVVAKPDESQASFGSAVKWSAVMSVGRQLGNLVVTFLLAWLLGPTTFGLVAIATVFVGFIQLVMQQGLGAALVQRRNLTSAHVNSGFFLVMCSAVVLSIVAFAASGWWADVNNEPRLGGVVRALTPLLFLRALIVVPDALLRREMRFRPLAMRTNLSVIGGGIAGVTAAVLGADVWSLVVQQLVAATLEVVILWMAVTWRPRREVSRSALSDLFAFSWRSAMATFGIFANDRADALIIGLTLGSTVVGLYRFAIRLVDTVIESISGSLQAVTLPELARHQHDPTALAERVLFLYRAATAACFIPLCALAAAGPAIVGVLGDEWSAATDAVAILALAGFGKVVGQLVGPIMQSVGRPGRLAVITWIAAAISAAVLFTATTTIADWSVSGQVVGLAMTTVVLHAVIFLMINVVLVTRTLGIGVLQLVATFVPGVLGGAAGFAAAWPVDRLVQDTIPFLRLVLVGGVAGVVAAAVILKLLPEARRPVRAVIARFSPSRR